MRRTIDVSLILPCYNEEAIFNESIEEIIKVLNKTKYNYEIIFIDDKSSDNTSKLIKKFILKKNRSNIRAIFHSSNTGRGQTVKDGFKAAKGQVVGYIDIDLETPAHYIPIFVDAIMDEKFDGAIAYRIYKFHLITVHRWIISSLYSTLRNIILNLPYQDTESGYKFFRKDIILPIVEKSQNPHWFWDTEIMTYSAFSKLSIKEIPTVFIKRSDKKSTVKLFKDSLTYLKELVHFSRRVQDETELEKYWKKSPFPFSTAYKEKNTAILGIVTNAFLNKRKNLVSTLLDRNEYTSSLDLGCGSGDFFDVLKKRSKNIIGLDYSSSMLHLAELRNKRDIKNGLLKLRLYDVSKVLDYPNNSFNLIIAIGLFDYVSNPQFIAKEIHRVLKHQGTAIITIPKTYSPYFFLRGKIGSYIRKKFLNLPPIIFWTTKNEASELFENQGFHIESINSVFSTMWVLKCTKSKTNSVTT